MKYIRSIDESKKEDVYKIEPSRKFIAVEDATTYLLEKSEEDIKEIFKKNGLGVEEIDFISDNFEIGYRVNSYGGNLPTNISEVMWKIYNEMDSEIFSGNLDGWGFSRNPYKIVYFLSPDTISDEELEDMVNLYLVKSRHNKRVI